MGLVAERTLALGPLLNFKQLMVIATHAMVTTITVITNTALPVAIYTTMFFWLPWLCVGVAGDEGGVVGEGGSSMGSSCDKVATSGYKCDVGVVTRGAIGVVSVGGLGAVVMGVWEGGTCSGEGDPLLIEGVVAPPIVAGGLSVAREVTEVVSSIPSTTHSWEPKDAMSTSQCLSTNTNTPLMLRIGPSATHPLRESST